MAGKQRPRNYIPLDVDYLAQDTIREIAADFGPGGPLAFLALILEAHKQAHAGGDKPQGVVVLRYGALAITAGVTSEQARGIVARAAEVGLLSLTGDDGRRFTAQLLKWDAWEARDVTAARRQARSRARKPAADDDLEMIWPDDDEAQTTM